METGQSDARSRDPAAGAFNCFQSVISALPCSYNAASVSDTLNRRPKPPKSAVIKGLMAWGTYLGVSKSERHLVWTQKLGSLKEGPEQRTPYVRKLPVGPRYV